MKKVIISVVGQDRPGIIARVSQTLVAEDGNIENVSQSILQGQFSGIFIVTIPRLQQNRDLEDKLGEQLASMHLYVHVEDFREPAPLPDPGQTEPFVITTRGPDRKGLVAGITEVIAAYQVNVSNLQAVFEGGDDPNRNIMIYEVDIPLSLRQSALRADLRQRAAELNLDISIQHRRIFEAINRL